MRRASLVVATVSIAASIAAGGGTASAAAPPATGCQPAACTATGDNVGLVGTTKKGLPNPNDPIAAAAGLYAWGMATEPDGSILTGDYWNYRIVHFEDDETASSPPTEAAPYVFTTSPQGFGTDTNQEPFGICVDSSGGPFEGYTYMTEGSLYDVIQYSPSGNWVTSWGTTNAANPAPFQYPSECTVGPNGYVYISNQWGTPTKSLQGVVILDPARYHATGSDGATTTGSPDVSAADFDLSAADVGAYVYGPGIPAGDTIETVTSSTQAVLTADVTATAANSALIVGLTIESPTGTGNLFIQPRGLAFDSAGDLWVADQGHSRVDIFYPGAGGVINMDVKKPSLVINPPLCSPSLPNCTNTTLTFDMRGLAIDTNTGLALVANGQGCVVQEFNANPLDKGSTTSPFGGFLLNFNGVLSGGTNCGTGTGQFEDGARGIAVDGQGEVWVADLGDFRTQVFSESGTPLWSVPATSTPPPTGGFNGPRGVAFDPAGDMYVTDTYNYRVEEFVPGGTSGGATIYSASFPPSCIAGAAGCDQAWGQRGDGPGDFNYARLMCWDPVTPLSSGGSGALIIANTDSDMAVGWNTAAEPPAVVQDPNSPYNAWDTSVGSPPVGTLADPYGVACDSTTGDVYVANGNGSDVVVLDASGNQIGTMQTTSGKKLGFTQGIWVDADGSVWVDSESNDTVYHFASFALGGAELGTFNLDSALAAYTGVSVASGAAGTYGIAGDQGYVYIALASYSEVVQLAREGASLPGGGSCGATLCVVGVFGGRGTKVGLMQTPQGLAFGPDGHLYVVEEGNDRVSQWVVP